MAASNDSAPPIVLHVWPPHESALSIDVECVAALLYLQLSIPGQYSIEYCNNPDLSPSGRLPFLTHGLHNVASLSSIAKYISQLEFARELDVHMSAVEKAQAIARVAHVEREIGDLVAHVFYALSTNWVGKTHPILVKMLPVPQRYFLPKRIRDSYKPRLESVELWDSKSVEEEEEEERLHWTFRRPSKKTKKADSRKKHQHVYARDRVLEKARTQFDIYTRILGGNAFIYQGDNPTILDVVLAAHLHLLHQPQPDSLLRDLLSESYPQLVAYSKSICQVAFPDPLAFPAVTSPDTSFSLPSMLSIPKFWRSTPQNDEGSPEIAKTVRQFRLLRWGFFAAVAATLGLYFKFGNLALQTQFLLSQNIPELKEVKEEIIKRSVEAQAMQADNDEVEVEGVDGVYEEEDDE